MSEIKNKIDKEQKNRLVGSDFWFRGVSNEMESGEITYFICENLENVLDDKTFNFKTHRCRLTGIESAEASDICTMDCEHFGKCDNCKGFSAIRCQACFIPRP